jgi:ParB family chromosome partitioning protein
MHTILQIIKAAGGWYPGLSLKIENPRPKEGIMQNSSEFQYIAIDIIHESATNPRRTFDECKIAELAESIRTTGLIQPITVRPNNSGFEIVAGARRFRAAQLAEVFSLPARIVDINDAQALEWQLVENSQRVDVHPYEEAQGFQRLLDMPGYDVATLVEKSGKSATHVYARLSLLQLVPSIAEAFTAERITASHANLLARLPQEHQVNAYEQCWRKDWNDKEPHLLSRPSRSGEHLLVCEQHTRVAA